MRHRMGTRSCLSLKVWEDNSVYAATNGEYGLLWMHEMQKITYYYSALFTCISIITNHPNKWALQMIDPNVRKYVFWA